MSSDGQITSMYLQAKASHTSLLRNLRNSFFDDAIIDLENLQNVCTVVNKNFNTGNLNDKESDELSKINGMAHDDKFMIINTVERRTGHRVATVELGGRPRINLDVNTDMRNLLQEVK